MPGIFQENSSFLSGLMRPVAYSPQHENERDKIVNMGIVFLGRSVRSGGSGLIMIVLLAALESCFAPLASAHAVVTSCDESSLRQAVNAGGLVTFDCRGTITVTDTIL